MCRLPLISQSTASMIENQCSSRDENSREWFADWFNNPLYLKVYLHRDTREAAICVSTILRITGLGNNPLSSRVLDIACGAGRHALEFARSGMQVTANDLSPFLLDEARRQAESERLNIQFTGSDMRFITPEGMFNIIVQLFSSFGYFDAEEDDRTVIRNVSNLLIPGGWYVLDLINPVYLKHHFRERTERTVDDLHIVEERKMSGKKVSKTITIRSNQDSPVSFTESVRLYKLPEISEMLSREGLDIVYLCGDYQGEPFDEQCSPRLILFARKMNGLI
jgi:SAM-dependent methyltransferase